MLKILKARLWQYMNRKLPDVQVGCRKCRGTREQIANIHWIIHKSREFQKNICFIDYTKTLDCVGHKRLWKILQEMEIPDHLTCLLRNLYAGQEATVRTIHQRKDWFNIWKECIKAVYCQPAYLTYMQSTSCEILGGLDEPQAWIKVSGEISITSDMQMTPPLWQKVKRN